MRILLPTDFSETADNAIQYAIRFFNRPGTTFVLYHSFMPFYNVFSDHKDSYRESKQDESELTERLQQKAAEIKEINPTVNVEIFVDKGVAETNIPLYAKSHQIELVIMGTTGASGLKETLVGSVTANVMNESGCPVLGIPEKYQADTLRNIAFCSNYQLDDLDALKYLIYLSKMLKANIQIWHFHKIEQEVGGEEQLSPDYREMITKIFGDQSFTFHFPGTDDIHAALDQLSERGDLDMISMITHKREGFFSSLLDKSLTKRMAYHSQLPLLAIPAQPGCVF